MKKPVIGITGNEKAHPDDELMMSYAAKGFVEGVKEAGVSPLSYQLVMKKWPVTTLV